MHDFSPSLTGRTVSIKQLPRDPFLHAPSPAVAGIALAGKLFLALRLPDFLADNNVPWCGGLEQHSVNYPGPVVPIKT